MRDGYPGYLSAMAIFPHDVFLRGRDALRAEVEGWVTKGVTPAEVREKKEELVGKMKVGLSTTEGICSALVDTLYAHRPVSYIDEYPQMLLAIPPREVNKAIHTHVRYDFSVTSASGSVDASGHPLC
jgi:predicted Zn-dependent peptidase